MNDIINIGLKYLKNNYSVIPVLLKTKRPFINDWGKYMFKPMDKAHFINSVNSASGQELGLALITGGAHSLTAIDIDLKYDITNDLYDRLKKEIGNKLLSKMYVNSTQNNGFHFIFKCSKLGGNTKLAMRGVVKEEKVKYFLDLVSKEDSDVNDCLRASLGYECKVLLETRAKGGYILIPPSSGYNHVFGKNIQEITTGEYDQLMNICMSFNTYIKKESAYNNKISLNDTSIDSEDITKNFNKVCDKLKLLESFGWRAVGNSSEGYIKILRPGATSGYSAYYNPKDNNFWVFSTSTRFPEQKAISAFEIIFELKYQSDQSKLQDVVIDMLDIIKQSNL